MTPGSSSGTRDSSFCPWFVPDRRSMEKSGRIVATYGLMTGGLPGGPTLPRQPRTVLPAATCVSTAIVL